MKKLVCSLTFHNTKFVSFTEEQENGYKQEYAIHNCLCGKHTEKVPVGDNVRLS